ncbi:MAG: oligosaccharide flippase family protein [Myxococcales bacterium]|nr:oligosaccharide flippase family protein [Myxococcales bacterium]
MALLPKGKFGRSVALVAGGTALGQVVSIIVSPLLTRLFSPDEFGIVAVYTSLVGIVAVVATLSFHSAIPLADEDQVAADVMFLAVLCAIGASVLALVLALLFRQRIAVLLGEPRLAPLLPLVPLGVLGATLYETLSQWAVRKKNFGSLGKTTVAKGVLQAGAQLTAGALGSGALGLLVGRLIGVWSGTLRLARDAMQTDATAIRGVRLHRLRAAISRFWRFPAYTLPAAAFNAISANTPALLLSFFFGSAVTGMYALALRVLGLPFAVVGTSVEKVFYSAAVDAKRAGTLGETTLNVFEKLLAMTLPMTLLIAVAAPEGFAVLFGDKWRTAGVYMQWMCLRTGLTLVVFPLMPLLNVLNRQHAGTAFQAVNMIARFGSFAVGGIAGSALLAIALQGAATGVCWLGLLLYMLAISGTKPARVAGIIGRKLAQSSLYVGAPLAAKLLGSHQLVVAGVAGICGLVFLAKLRRSGVLGELPASKLN